MSTSTVDTEKLKCVGCGGERNHFIVHQHKEKWQDEEAGEHGYEINMIAKCAGCDTVRFARKTWDTSLYDPDEYETSEKVIVYPEDRALSERPDAFSLFDLPNTVEQMYREARVAFASGANTLCGVGLRAIVEALCRDQGLSGNLAKMIDELVTKGHLAKAQADFLHEERYLGNAAVHEMERPSNPDLEDGFSIIEGLLRTIYVLPAHAARLRKKREARSKK
jgi:hypothetical protein